MQGLLVWLSERARRLLLSLTPTSAQIARKHHWRETRQWLWGILIGGCLPFWGSAFILRLFARQTGLEQLTGRGELALFSAGIFASAMPVLRRTRGADQIAAPQGLQSLCVALLMISAFVLSAVTLSDNFPQLPKPEPATLLASSVSLFVLALVIGFYVELTNNVRTDPNLMKLVENDEVALRERFTKQLGR